MTTWWLVEHRARSTGHAGGLDRDTGASARRRHEEDPPHDGIHHVGDLSASPVHPAMEPPPAPCRRPQALKEECPGDDPGCCGDWRCCRPGRPPVRPGEEPGRRNVAGALRPQPSRLTSLGDFVFTPAAPAALWPATPCSVPPGPAAHWMPPSPPPRRRGLPLVVHVSTSGRPRPHPPQLPPGIRATASHSTRGAVPPAPPAVSLHNRHHSPAPAALPGPPPAWNSADTTPHPH